MFNESWHRINSASSRTNNQEFASQFYSFRQFSCSLVYIFSIRLSLSLLCCCGNVKFDSLQSLFSTLHKITIIRKCINKLQVQAKVVAKASCILLFVMKCWKWIWNKLLFWKSLSPYFDNFYEFHKFSSIHLFHFIIFIIHSYQKKVFFILNKKLNSLIQLVLQTLQALALTNFHHKLSGCSFYFAFVYENKELHDDAHT